jgi:hypothetical protein
MEYVFRNKNGHIEVYDATGAFVLSADSEREAREELRAQQSA